MADHPRSTPAASAARGERPLSLPRVMGLLYASRVRSQASFRTSFVADVLGQMLVVGTEFLELWVILSQVGVLGGMTLTQVAVVYGLGALAFGLADLFFGEIDGLSTMVRSGKLETLLIRPLPVLLQISSMDLSLRRLGRILVGLSTYVIALVVAGFSPTPLTLLLAVTAPLAGAAVFAALLR